MKENCPRGAVTYGWMQTHTGLCTTKGYAREKL
jgi:hypothetical protein